AFAQVAGIGRAQKYRVAETQLPSVTNRHVCFTTPTWRLQLGLCRQIRVWQRINSECISGAVATAQTDVKIITGPTHDLGGKPSSRRLLMGVVIVGWRQQRRTDGHFGHAGVGGVEFHAPRTTAVDQFTTHAGRSKLFNDFPTPAL